MLSGCFPFVQFLLGFWCGFLFGGGCCLQISLLNLEKAPLCLVTLVRANHYSSLHNKSASKFRHFRGHLIFKGGSQKCSVLLLKKAASIHIEAGRGVELPSLRLLFPSPAGQSRQSTKARAGASWMLLLPRTSVLLCDTTPLQAFFVSIKKICSEGSQTLFSSSCITEFFYLLLYLGLLKYL